MQKKQHLICKPNFSIFFGTRKYTPGRYWKK